MTVLNRVYRIRVSMLVFFLILMFPFHSDSHGHSSHHSHDDHHSHLPHDDHHSHLSHDDHHSHLPHDDHHSHLSHDDHHSHLPHDDHHSHLSHDDHHSHLPHDDHHSHLPHDHFHTHEPKLEHPAYKYSKEANVQIPVEKDYVEIKQNVSKSSALWLEAFTATVIISLAPYFILFLIPVHNIPEHKTYLKLLLAFASGGLLGDAFLHLIPHALMAQQDTFDHRSHSHSHSHAHSHSHSHAHSHSHSHSHSHDDDGVEGFRHDMTIGVSVLSGIIIFLIVEKFVRILKGGHSHSHVHVDPNNVPKNSEKNAHSSDGKKSVKNSKNKVNESEKSEDIKVAGYLNLAADFTHNLTDGLAIGASFVAGRPVGIITSLTIFLHEIPHEIGDFAILLQSGCSKKKAMCLQLVTAVGALTGTLLSLLAEDANAESIYWILPLTAGGFIYIATVSVIPELLVETTFWQSVWEVAALLGGVGLMLAIAVLEEAGHSTSSLS